MCRKANWIGYRSWVFHGWLMKADDGTITDGISRCFLPSLLIENSLSTLWLVTLITEPILSYHSDWKYYPNVCSSYRTPIFTFLYKKIYQILLLFLFFSFFIYLGLYFEQIALWWKCENLSQRPKRMTCSQFATFCWEAPILTKTVSFSNIMHVIKMCKSTTI